MTHKWLLTLAFLLIVGAGVAAILYAQNETKDPVPVAKTTVQEGNAAKVVGTDVSFTITEGDHKRWEIHSSKAYYYPNQKGTVLENVTGTLFNDVGEPSATFKAPTGEFSQGEKKIFLSGGVTVVGTGDDPMTLEAPQMEWSPKTEQVVADGGIKMGSQKFGQSTATRCKFSMDFASIALEGNAQTQLDL